MEDEFGMSICGWPYGARGIEAAHVLPKTDGTSGGEGDSGYGQYGRSSRWVTTKSVGGCRVFFYAWDASEEVEDYGTRSVSSSRRGDYIQSCRSASPTWMSMLFIHILFMSHIPSITLHEQSHMIIPQCG